MSTLSTPRDISTPLSRITWRDGQTLMSRDLRDDQLYVERLRHLHIRYQHKTWGVVEGLTVASVGSSAVAVRRGYALDIEGCELLVPVLTLVPVPSNGAAAVTIYLVISQGTTTAGCAPGPDLATLCPCVQNPMPIEQGLLSWKTVTQVRPGYDVLLARALVSSGSLSSAVDMSIQRFAATMNEPVIWSDGTVPGQTGWTDAMDPEPVIKATVDTSDGGFLSTPAYFASLAGTSDVALGFITSAGAKSFDFEVRFTSGGTSNAATAESKGWTITWLAIELGGN